MSEDNTLVLDLDNLKISEIEDIEDALGCSIETALEDGKPRGKTLRVIAWMLKRRENPSFTLEQAGDLVIVFSQAAPVDPIEPVA